jgi:hypothetical protein
LRDDPDFRTYILDLTRREHTNRTEAEDRFYEILAELLGDREEQARKWEDQNCKWDKLQQELKVLTEEQNRKWEANQQELLRLHEEIMAQAKKHDRSIGALGARWEICNRRKHFATRWREFWKRTSACR